MIYKNKYVKTQQSVYPIQIGMHRYLRKMGVGEGRPDPPLLDSGKRPRVWTNFNNLTILLFCELWEVSKKFQKIETFLFYKSRVALKRKVEQGFLLTLAQNFPSFRLIPRSTKIQTPTQFLAPDYHQ